MGQQGQGAERRKHVRIRKNYILRFSEKGLPSIKYELSQIENISRGGLCFTSTLPFSEGALLLLELRTPYISDSIHLEGEILRSEEKVSGLIFQNHLKFTHVSPIALDILDKIEKYNTRDNPK